MPELPEVEYTVRQLQAHLVGATIQDVSLFWLRTVGHPDPECFRAQIAGQSILRVHRRAKYILVDLSGEQLLIIHRRMTGNFLLLPPGWQIDESLRERDPAAWSTKGPTFFTGNEHSYSHELGYCRVCFHLADGRLLLFTDPRKFGRVELWPAAQEQEILRTLGPEPLDESFTANVLAQGLAARKGPIKQALLDQSIVAGIGNIYADEALFVAGIHPLRRAGSLNADEAQRLRDAIVSVLSHAIEHGGTSFNDYRDLWGEAGENFSHVRVYQRTGQPCGRCGSTIERIVVGQRSTHFCPGCQQLTVE
jgi:formamidopyrimidine-DNA glycosylase